MATSGDCGAPPPEGATDAAAGAEAGPVDAGAPPPVEAAPPDAPCVRLTSRPERRGLDLMLLVDASPSVVLQPMWGDVTQAMLSFVEDPAHVGLGVGVQYFGLSCLSADYVTPAVAIGVLPAPTDAIRGSIPLPLTGKALTPALAGTSGYARTHMAQTPDRDTALVLISDAVLDPLCGSTKEGAAAAAAAALAETPSLPTYVIALGAGPSLLDPAALVKELGNLDSIAAAGGTGGATRVQVELNAHVALAEALSDVAVAAAPCAYRIPDGFVPERLGADWEVGPGSSAVTWPQVDGPAACGGSVAIYVRGDGYFGLCPAACDAVRSHPAGTLLATAECPAR